jgi:nucleoside 2-deoxyribosyltransferase
VGVLKRERGRKETLQAFVAMMATGDWQPICRAIERGIVAAGYQPFVVMKVEHNQKIDDLIIGEIRRSRFLIADFTGHRQSVYFEAGFAMGLGIPVIWTCRRDQLAEAHFDTRQYSHIDWETHEELVKRLEERIRAIIT